jgi:hypothetical protein
VEDVHIISNSPYLSVVQEAMPELAIHAVSTREEAARIVEAEPDVLYVDTFPRGLGGELASILPSLQARKLLIHRALNPDYAAKAGLRGFVETNYDIILCPGERGVLSDLPQAVFTPAWLVRPPVAVTQLVEIVICASGNAEELSWYGEAAALLSGRASVRCIAAELPPGCPPDAWTRHWPSIDWIAGAKAVIGGAGYNTVHECLATGVPLIARPWPRKYDLQRWRAEQHSGITIVDTPQQAAAKALHVLAARPGYLEH